MSQFDKLISRLDSLDKNLRFEELTKILEYYGYKASFPKGGSSHCTFRKTGKPPVTIPARTIPGKEYVKLVKKAVEKEN